MGIKSLHKWLSWVTSPPPAVNWSHWSEKRIGIDILGLLYKAKYDNQEPTESIARLIVLLKKHSIQPIFVFDGKSPQEKQTTCTQRRRQKEQLPDAQQKLACIHSNERNEIKQLLYATGCVYLNANEEADSLLAYMYKNAHIDAVISMDMDFLARGCEKLLVPYKSKWQEYTLSKILAESKLSYERFVELCVLLGTDYNPHIPSLSYQRIYWSLIIGNLTMSEILAKEGIRNDFLWSRAYQLLLGKEYTWDSLLSEKQREKWKAGIPNTEYESCVTMFPTWSLTDLAWLYYTPVNKSAETAIDLRAADAAVLEPRTTIQNVPIENMKSIRNSIADSNI